MTINGLLVAAFIFTHTALRPVMRASREK